MYRVIWLPNGWILPAGQCRYTTRALGRKKDSKAPSEFLSTSELRAGSRSNPCHRRFGTQQARPIRIPVGLCPLNGPGFARGVSPLTAATNQLAARVF
eukprot:scaffold48_cov311-Pinguiococcus_pyrenoidosus.AAC.126